MDQGELRRPSLPAGAARPYKENRTVVVYLTLYRQGGIRSEVAANGSTLQVIPLFSESRGRLPVKASLEFTGSTPDLALQEAKELTTRLLASMRSEERRVVTVVHPPPSTARLHFEGSTPDLALQEAEELTQALLASIRYELGQQDL